MNIPRFLAALLLAAPAAATAAPHAVAVRASKGLRAYSHTVKAESGDQANFMGPVGGQNMTINVTLSPKGDAFSLGYQIEVSQPDGGSSFQVQSSVALRPGERLTTVEFGDWKLDLSLDAGGRSGAPRAWDPKGPNHRLTTLAGRRRCRLVQEAGTQGNIVDSSTVNGRKSGSIFNAMLASPVGNACKLQYQFEDSSGQAQGEETLVLGQKASSRSGKIEFLLEGPSAAPAAAPAVAPASSPAPAPANEPAQQGAVPLLR